MRCVCLLFSPLRLGATTLVLVYTKKKKKRLKKEEKERIRTGRLTRGARGGEGGEEAVKNVTTKRAGYGDGECVWLPDKERGSGGTVLQRGEKDSDHLDNCC